VMCTTRGEYSFQSSNVLFHYVTGNVTMRFFGGEGEGGAVTYMKAYIFKTLSVY
jgi:hypothetical protein